MAESGRQIVYNIHIHSVQEGDNFQIEERNETNFINSSIEQVNIQQQDAGNNLADDSVSEDQDEITGAVDEMNFSSSGSASSAVKKKGSTSSDHGLSLQKQLPDVKKGGRKSIRSEIIEDADNNVAEEPVVADQDEIIEMVDEMNLSPSGSASSSVNKKRSTSSDQGLSLQKQLPDVKKGRRKSIRTEIIEEKFASLCARSKFAEAASCIDQLTSEQRKNVGLTTSLRMSACYFELGNDRKIKKTRENLTRLLMTSPSDVDDIINFANYLTEDKSYFRALVLFRIASDVYTRHPSLSADEIVRGIADCVSKMNDAVEPMIASGGRSKTIALKYGCVYMSEMVENLRAVEKADSAINAELGACCVKWIGTNHSLAGEYEKSIEFYKIGVDIMERQFGKNASKYQIYDHLLHNLGASNKNLGRYSIAAEYYKKALAVYNDASDFRNESEKQKCLEITMNSLEINRRSMK